MCTTNATYCHKTNGEKVCKTHLTNLTDDERKNYELIKIIWNKLNSELIDVEKDILFMEERLGFIIRLSEKGSNAVENLKTGIEKHLSDVLKIAQETFD